MWDVIGVGANSVDYVYRLPTYPRPDTPAAKLRISSHRVSFGGQTTTALCMCAALGLRAKYIGAFGNDEAGTRMREELARHRIDLEHAVIRDAANPFAVILLDNQQGERIVLWDRDSRLALHSDELPAALIRATRLLHVDDVDQEAALRAAAVARAAGIPVTSDIEALTDRTNELVAAVTIPIFAEHVLQALTGEDDFERALRKVRRTHDGLLCVTLGSRGAMLLDGDRVHHEPGLPVKVVDTTGAGDIFRGAFIYALLRGNNPADILRFANAAAAMSCTKEGAIASVPTMREIGL
jgi:sugar/nucleoside kinase (ribokinase family)